MKFGTFLRLKVTKFTKLRAPEIAKIGSFRKRKILVNMKAPQAYLKVLKITKPKITTASTAIIFTQCDLKEEMIKVLIYELLLK